MKKVSSDRFALSDSFHVQPAEESEIPLKDSEEFMDKFDVLPKDDSLNFTGYDDQIENNLEAPLLTVSTDTKELVEDFIHDCRHIDEFYEREKNRISKSFDQFYQRFLMKLNSETTPLNLESDLKEHGLDGLGYASSWARQFAEFYSKFSWLDGFAKINIVAMQKIQLKFDGILFNANNSELYNKLSAFLKTLQIAEENGCFQERRKIRGLFALHYYNNNTQKAIKFLEFNVSDFQSEERIPLYFLIGMILSLLLIWIFFMLTKADQDAVSFYEINHTFPIFRSLL